MSNHQFNAIVRLAQKQERTIKRLVNLLNDVLDGEPDASAEATHYLYVATRLYEHIEKGQTKKPG